LDKYMIMPNHFNGIIKICNVIVETGLQPVSTTEILSEFVRALKTFSSKRINKLRNISKDEKGFKPFSTVWQPGFYDHIIRNNKDLNKIRKYINDNPLFLDDRNLVNVANVVLIFYNFLYSVQHCLQYQAYLSNKLPILFY